MPAMQRSAILTPLAAGRLQPYDSPQPPCPRAVDILADFTRANDRQMLFRHSEPLLHNKHDPRIALILHNFWMYSRTFALFADADYWPPSTDAPPIQLATSETVMISIRPISIIKPTA